MHAYHHLIIIGVHAYQQVKLKVDRQAKKLRVHRHPYGQFSVKLIKCKARWINYEASWIKCEAPVDTQLYVQARSP